MKTRLLLFIVLIVCGSVTLAEEMPRKWSLNECLEYGLKHHPLLRVAENNIETEEARLQQTRAYWDPKLDMRASWSRRRTETGPSNDPLIDSTSESVGISKVLLDSGQNHFDQLAIKNSLESVRARQINTELEIAAGIKKAFFSAQQAQALVVVREETLDGYQKHLEKVEGFVEVGTRAPYDITRARVDVANAQVELISAKSRRKVAIANLARAVGLEDELDIADFSMTAVPVFNSAKQELRQDAFARPEMQSAQYEIESANARVSGLKRSLKPVVAASADYSWNGTTTPLNRQWAAGISLNWSFFDGDLTRSRIKSARAQLDSAKESYRNLKLSVNTEVENAVTGLEDSLERFKATEILVQQASESMYLAEGRYDAGLGNPIEINDARVEYARARGNYVVAYFDSLIAVAELERVTGKLPAEYRIQPIDLPPATDKEKN